MDPGPDISMRGVSRRGIKKTRLQNNFFLKRQPFFDASAFFLEVSAFFEASAFVLALHYMNLASGASFQDF